MKCQEICADTPHCVAYTFVETNKRCDLKDSAGAWKLSSGSGLVSGKLEELEELDQEKWDWVWNWKHEEQ